MIRRPPRSTQSRSSAASDVYKRQELSKECHKPSNEVMNQIGERKGMLEIAMIELREKAIQLEVEIQSIKKAAKSDVEIRETKIRALEQVISSSKDFNHTAYSVAELEQYNRTLQNKAKAVSYTHLTLPTIYSV
eukprot:TRINITY_DN19655_c0_g1_i1.p1 TRINITY_DN19655_c0_g1~~TRINITY_DN19655_c0_g1_i1.p1  ORF type:complete len:146 (+),score=38.16 TRINITY_DN19655_c0_g1_i1:38-439(+)